MHEGPADTIWAWNFHPSIVVGTAAMVGVYLIAAGPLRERLPGSRPVRPAQKASFVTGMAIIFLSLVTPLDHLGDEYLLSAHMVQHLLMGLVAPPFLIWGTPGWMLRPFLRYELIARAARLVTMPLVAYGLFQGDFLIWHVPAFYEAALGSLPIHIFQHFTFMVAGVISWWPIMSSLPELPRLPYPFQIVYLFLEAFPSTLLGALLVFSPNALYPTYAAAERVFGVGALQDQQVAGLIMWMPGGMIYLLALTVVFFTWMGRDEPSPQPKIARPEV